MRTFELNEREQLILLFALHRFVDSAYERANSCAQKEFGSRASDFEKFYKDAKDGERLIDKLRVIEGEPK
jgi:hypothetical protein